MPGRLHVMTRLGIVLGASKRVAGGRRVSARGGAIASADWLSELANSVRLPTLSRLRQLIPCVGMRRWRSRRRPAAASAQFWSPYAAGFVLRRKFISGTAGFTGIYVTRACRSLSVGASPPNSISPQRTKIAPHSYYQEFQAPFGLRWFAGVKLGSGDEICALCPSNATSVTDRSRQPRSKSWAYSHDTSRARPSLRELSDLPASTRRCRHSR